MNGNPNRDAALRLIAEVIIAVIERGLPKARKWLDTQRRRFK